MELTKNSWHQRFFIATFTKSTENFCDYFWGLLLALVTVPLTWSMYFIPKWIDETNNPYYLWKLYAGTVINAVIALLIHSIQVTYWIDWLFYAGVVILVIGVIIGVIFFIYWYKESEVKTQLKESVSIPVEAVKSFKGKYCPKIKWVEKSQNESKALKS